MAEAEADGDPIEKAKQIIEERAIESGKKGKSTKEVEEIQRRMEEELRATAGKSK